MNRLFSFKIFVVLAMTLLPAASGVADYVVRELGKEDGEPSRFFVPYGFSSEAMGFVAGVAGGISGLPQEQNSFFTTALVSDEGAAAVYAFFNDYQLSRIQRLFVDAAVGLGEFPQQRAYLDTSPPKDKPPAGSNDSSADDYFRTDGLSKWMEIDFKYVLDIGHGRYTPINTYTLSNGLLVGGASGGGVFNPFKSGRSYLQAKLFYQDRDYDDVDPSTALKTSGIGLSFKYDNTDFQVNPSTGNVLEIGVKHDPGNYDNNSWTVGELEFSQYFKLTPGPKMEQSVIAFDFWTSHNFGDDAPPYYMGPTLGGLYRLRAYPIERFHDTSAIYYSAEYRVIPESDLLRSLSFLEFANLQWWSLAAFIEYGRVAPEWDLKELHESMKYDVGLSMRVMAAQNIARIDLVWSKEDTAAWLMYGHPF
jgi:hypothetical protein